MKQASNFKAVTGVSIMAAVAASLCCITPLLAIVAGASGAASAFSWLVPARPFLIGITIATLSFAWYRSFSKKESALCGLDGSCKVEKNSFLASSTFLVFTTITAIGLMAFPYYAKLFYPKPDKQNIVVVKEDQIQSASFYIEGMTCVGCEAHVNNELQKVPGVMEAKTAYEKGTSIVKFNGFKATIPQLQAAIEKTGYKVIEVK